MLASLAATVATVVVATAEVATVEVATVEVATVEVVVQWAGTHGGELCNTISSCYLPKKIQHQ